jgi:hypothetical protein
LNRAKKEGANFINNYSEIQLNYALPLIDSAVALELARLSGINNGGILFNLYSGYAYAIGLQYADDSLKKMFLTALLAYDKLCNDVLITKNEYSQQAVNGKYIYEYSNILKNAMLRQVQKNDTNLLTTANKEFEFWAPFASDYFETIAKPGWHQLSIGKRKFKTCMFAAPKNAALWASCIYLVTGKEDYGSSNDQLNEVYKKCVKIGGVKRNPEERKGFIRLGEPHIITSPLSTNTLDSLDFESIPSIKEKFAKNKKKDDWEIVIYTNGAKALIFLYYSESIRIGISKRLIGSSSTYLVELKTPSTLQLTSIDYRERYY